MDKEDEQADKAVD